MHILLVEFDLHLPAAQSLKDKRAVLQSVKHHIRANYNASLAEVDYLDKWQRTTLAMVAVGLQKNRLEEMERQVSGDLEARFDLVLTGQSMTWL